MFRVLLLILIVMSSVAFAQTEENPQATKYDEFETATNGYVKARMDAYYIELNNNPTTQGYIFNFGTDKEIAVREKQIRNSITFLKLDAPRVTLVRGGFRGIVQTQLWLVSPGAETPTVESTSTKIDEFEKTTNGDIKARFDSFFIELDNNPSYQGYIVNYGSTKVVLAREKLIRKYLVFRKSDLSRIKFLKGGAREVVKTEFWVDSPKVKNS
jgi:hypothetical protein